MPRKASKRTAQGAGSIRQRPDGRWEARYTPGRDPGTGKQIQKSVYGKTQDEVRKKLAKITASIDEGTYTAPERMTVGQWLDTWVAEYLGGLKDTTAVSYEQIVRTHLKPAFGAVKLAALHTTAIQRFCNGLLRREKPLSPKTVKNVHGVLHKALNVAVKLGYIRVNPSTNCELPRAEKPEMQPLDTPDMAVFLEAIKGHRLEKLYFITLFTGIREAEALGLQWSCVDLENGSITIDKQLHRPRRKGGKYYFGPPKNDKTRVISIAPFLVQVLKERRKEQLSHRMRAGSAWDEGAFQNLVFTNEVGKHLSYKVVLGDLKGILKETGIGERRFHDLRHSYAVNALRSGDDVKTVQGNLGHHTAAFTLDQYGHVTETMKKESAARMEAYYNSLKQAEKKL